MERFGFLRVNALDSAFHNFKPGRYPCVYVCLPCPYFHCYFLFLFLWRRPSHRKIRLEILRRTILSRRILLKLPTLINQRLVKSRSDLKISGLSFKKFEKEYAEMESRESALQISLAAVLEQRKVDALKRPDGELEDRVRDTIRLLKDSEDQLATVVKQNSIMKKRLNFVESQELEYRQRAGDAEANRNEMHQALFESLLLSDDEAQQQMAFEHLFSCVDKYEAAKLPISIQSPKLLKPVSQLTFSDSVEVKRQASRCLFSFKPDSAIDAGIQFGPLWRPLEYSKSNANTHRIYETLEHPCNVVFEEEPLMDFVNMLQRHNGLGVRLGEDVDEDLPITYTGTGRSLFLNLSGMLEEHKLGFAISDDES